MPPPLFSIIITCFNQRAFIADAVQSAISQRCPDREVIVVDDGSTDGSVEVLQQFADRIQLIRHEANIGAVDSRNHGVADSHGNYLVFLDGDDALMPWALDVYQQLVINRAPTMILARLRWVENTIPSLDEEKRPLQVSYVPHENFISKDRACELSASGLVVERKAFCQCGWWTPGIFYLDLVDLTAKLGMGGLAIQIMSPATVVYRAHAGNSIWDVAPFLDMARRLIDKERRGDYPGGREYRARRRAWLGGQVFFWAKRAVQHGLYRPAISVIGHACDMTLAAILRRFLLLLKGRTQIRTEPLGFRDLRRECGLRLDS